MTYQHRPLFRLGKDTTPYRKLTSEGVKVEKLGEKEVLTVSREAIRLLAEQAMMDINHLLRPGHLAQLRKILDDPEATGNDKFVAFDLLKNANIAAGGILPMCQDTGTAIVMGKKGRLIWTDGEDESALAEGDPGAQEGPGPPDHRRRPPGLTPAGRPRRPGRSIPFLTGP
jgi:fumarate hydratase class I